MMSSRVQRGICSKRLALSLGIALAIAVAACSDAPPAPPEPVPGMLTVHLVTPNSDDRAVLLRVAGPVPSTDVEGANAAYVVHARHTENAFRAAAFGAIANGPVYGSRFPT